MLNYAQNAQEAQEWIPYHESFSVCCTREGGVGVYMRKESLLFAVTSACSRRAVPSVLLKWKVASHSYQGTQATIFPYCDIYSMGHAEFSEVMLELR